jgi:hypothetical protein
VRVRGLLEQQRVLELPLYLTAIRELQSHSPLVYWTHANWMVLDIPRVLEGREEQRWRWIRDGLAVLEEGRRRFPRHRNILWQGATTYYLRFHPEDQPRDRARFLRDRTLNPEGADPVDIAIDYMEDDLLLDEHEWIEDFFMLTLLETRRLLLEEAAAAGRLPAARAHQGTRALVERGLRLLRHSRASHREDAASVADTVDAAARHFREVLAELEEGFVPGESGPVPPGGAGRSS